MAWFTTDEGKHVNTDWFDEDEKRKYKQLEQNQQEADKLNGKIGQQFKDSDTPKAIDESMNYIVKKVALDNSKDADYGSLSGSDVKSMLKGYHYEADFEMWFKNGVPNHGIEIKPIISAKESMIGNKTKKGGNIERNSDGEILFKAMVTDRETGKRHSMEFSARTVEQARTDLSKNGYRVTPSTMLPKKLFDRVMNETNGYEWDWEDARKEFKEEMAKIQRRERRERRKNSQSGIDSYVQKAFDKANLIGESVDLDKVINSYKVLRDLPEAQKEEIYKDLAFRLFGARY